MLQVGLVRVEAPRQVVGGDRGAFDLHVLAGLVIDQVGGVRAVHAEIRHVVIHDGGGEEVAQMRGAERIHHAGEQRGDGRAGRALVGAGDAARCLLVACQLQIGVGDEGGDVGGVDGARVDGLVGGVAVRARVLQRACLDDGAIALQLVDIHIIGGLVGGHPHRVKRLGGDGHLVGGVALGVEGAGRGGLEGGIEGVGGKARGLGDVLLGKRRARVLLQVHVARAVHVVLLERGPAGERVALATSLGIVGQAEGALGLVVGGEVLGLVPCGVGSAQIEGEIDVVGDVDQVEDRGALQVVHARDTDRLRGIGRHLYRAGGRGLGRLIPVIRDAGGGGAEVGQVGVSGEVGILRGAIVHVIVGVGRGGRRRVVDAVDIGDGGGAAGLGDDIGLVFRAGALHPHVAIGIEAKERHEAAIAIVFVIVDLEGDHGGDEELDDDGRAVACDGGRGVGGDGPGVCARALGGGHEGVVELIAGRGEGCGRDGGIGGARRQGLVHQRELGAVGGGYPALDFVDGVLVGLVVEAQDQRGGAVHVVAEVRLEV